MAAKLPNLIDLNDRREKLKEREKTKHQISITDKIPPGFKLNPLLSIPRDIKCPCDSGRKYEDCHLLQMPPIIPEDLADEYTALMKGVPFEQLKFEGDIENGDKKSNS